MFPEVTIGLVCPYNVALGEEYWTSNKRSSRCGRLTLHPKLEDHATVNIGVLMAGSYVKPIPRKQTLLNTSSGVVSLSASLTGYLTPESGPL